MVTQHVLGSFTVSDLYPCHWSMRLLWGSKGTMRMLIGCHFLVESLGFDLPYRWKVIDARWVFSGSLVIVRVSWVIGNSWDMT